jgi:hypothetical protein
MNIFVLDSDPCTCARYHCDKHVVKMILESTQLLTNAYYLDTGITSRRQFAALDAVAMKKLMRKFRGFPRRDENNLPTPYPPTHWHHPCSRWARATIENWRWLCELGLQLCAEYTRRYGRQHLCQSMLEWMSKHEPSLPSGTLTPFAQAMPEEIRIPDDPIGAYRQYYHLRKARFARWRHSETPQWWAPPDQID